MDGRGNTLNYSMGLVLLSGKGTEVRMDCVDQGSVIVLRSFNRNTEGEMRLV